MKVNVYGKELTISNEMQERISDKLSFLDKYLLIDPETIGQAIVKKHGNDIKLEITIPSKIGYLRSEVIDHDLKDAIDTSISKLEDQIRRQKTRLSRRHKEKLSKSFLVDFAEEEREETVVKTKRVVIDSMNEDEAILQMELMDHQFFAYKDEDCGLVSIIYKRKDGDYGILEIV